MAQPRAAQTSKVAPAALRVADDVADIKVLEIVTAATRARPQMLDARLPIGRIEAVDGWLTQGPATEAAEAVGALDKRSGDAAAPFGVVDWKGGHG